MTQRPPVTEITVEEARAFRQGRQAAVAGRHRLNLEGAPR